MANAPAITTAAHVAPNPPGTATASAFPIRNRFAGATAWPLLRDMWRLPLLRPGTRAASVEVHNDSWDLLSTRELRKSIVSYGDPVRLQCLASKLLSNRPVKVNILGGSVSFGTTFTTSRSRSLFHWKVYQWLNATFPGPMHEHFSGAVPASGPSYMEHCVHWHVIEGADLVLVEYAVNFDEDLDEDARSFERMIRKLLRMKGQPTVVIVNTMELIPPLSSGVKRGLHFSAEAGEKHWIDGYSEGWANWEDLSFEYRARAEDKINAVAQYYGVPCISLRNAIFPLLKANSTRFPLKKVFHDRHHPGAWGHSLLAQSVVELLRETVADADTWQQRGRDVCAEAAAEWEGGRDALTQVTPLLSEDELPDIGMCTKADGLQAITLPSGTKGFEYLVEGQDAKMKPGMIGSKAGDTLQLCVDVSRLDEGDDFVIILGHLISYAHMGVVRVDCVGGCECTGDELDSHVKDGHLSVFKARTYHSKRVKSNITAARSSSGLALGVAPCGCALQITILEKTNSGEHKFKVLSLMTSLAEGSLRYGHQAGFNVRPTGAGRLH